MIKNSKGKVWYGLHFYPGVAQYQEEGHEPYRVFLNEDTLRKMDPTFAGRPIFVEHVDEVNPDLNKLRTEAEGWVVESFFNAADGMHWVKFMTVTDDADRAIRNGHRLSNAYIPKSFKEAGLWNGVPYAKEITDGEYEHLALVRNPRYEESVIKTPDEFKEYNEQKIQELKKLSNSTEKGTKMKFNFFKKAKVDNSADIEVMSVVLPKSGKEISITALINAADEKEMDKNSGLADMTHKVKMHDGSYMNIGDLMDKHKAVCDELEAMKMKKEDSAEKEMDLDVKEKGVDSESGSEMSNVDEMHPEKEVHDAMGEEKKPMAPQEPEDKEIKDAKKKNAREKADRLRNAPLRAIENEAPAPTLELSYDRVVRGKQRYGS